jgi:hypothetical protein
VKQSSNAKKLKTDNNLKEGKNNEKEMLVKKMQNGRNKNKNIQRQNNTVVYNHKDINLTKSDVEENEKKKVVNHNKNNVLRVKNGNIKKKNSKNKVGKGNNIVTNLIDDFDQTMEEYSSIYTSQNNASRGKNSAKNNNIKSKTNKGNSKSKVKGNNINTKYSKNKLNVSNDSNPISHSVILDRNSNSLNRRDDTNRIQTTEKRKIKGKINIENSKKNHQKKKSKGTEVDLDNSNLTSGSIIKIKKSKGNMKFNLKEEELPLFRGEIDYNNVSIKNINDSIDDLMNRYKKKGFTCMRKGKTEFKFIKGPNTHHVEIMRLGNGLLYFNVTKKI